VLDDVKVVIKELNKEVISIQIKLKEIETQKTITVKDVDDVKKEINNIKNLIGQAESKLDEKVQNLSRFLFGASVTFVFSLIGAILAFIFKKLG